MTGYDKSPIVDFHGGKAKIARVWRGTTRPADADIYLDYIQRTGTAHCLDTPGNRGVRIVRHIVDGKAEFLFVSLWKSMDAIHAFAGPNPEKTVDYPEEAPKKPQRRSISAGITADRCALRRHFYDTSGVMPDRHDD
ncbi:hypothetical protein LVJ94_09925 [Pendulispora rubella]|uniref:ABM domain-containing protein n=1 Tax=Pendulispora rubella TaxID=2741070 RepID=A0ABZ2L9F6_9BACT